MSNDDVKAKLQIIASGYYSIFFRKFNKFIAELRALRFSACVLGESIHSHQILWWRWNTSFNINEEFRIGKRFIAESELGKQSVQIRLFDIPKPIQYLHQMESISHGISPSNELTHIRTGMKRLMRRESQEKIRAEVEILRKLQQLKSHTIGIV